MLLAETIETDLLTATKAKEELKRDTLRLLKSAIKNEAINLGVTQLTDEQTIAIIRREVKKRQESILAYKQVNKPELVAAEEAEAAILACYLPAQLSEEAIKEKISQFLATHPEAAGKPGQIIGALAAEFKGQADMSLVARLVNQQLKG